MYICKYKYTKIIFEENYQTRRFFEEKSSIKLAVLLYKIVNSSALQRMQLYYYIIERKTAEKQYEIEFKLSSNLNTSQI